MKRNVILDSIKNLCDKKIRIGNGNNFEIKYCLNV